jgi:hypothetical protein
VQLNRFGWHESFSVFLSGHVFKPGANHHDGGVQDRFEFKHRCARCNSTLVQFDTFMKFAGRARMKISDMDFRRRLFNVYQIKQPIAGKHAAVIAIICGAISVLPASRAWSITAESATGTRRISSHLQLPALLLAADSASPLAPVAQDEGDDEDRDVPTSQVDKYISVYEAMQKNHDLTVEQATSRQGLTVDQFRALENKIEADDTLRERVRKALRHAANPKDTSEDD